MSENKFHAIVYQLELLIEKNDWFDDFNAAIEKVASYKIPTIKHIKNLEQYLNFVNDFVVWSPKVTREEPRHVYDELCEFYFFLDQPSLKQHQNKIEPGEEDYNLTPLSQWIIDFAKDWGSYLDTLESADTIKSYKNDPYFNWNEYMPPPSGYKTFNQFFARHVKPGMRPVAAMRDNNVIVSPADCTLVGWWQVGENSNIEVQRKIGGIIESKIFTWSIHDLLKDSRYADRFKGGIFTHSFLNTYDYHRWHSPVQGKLLESKVIQGQAMLTVDTKKGIDKNGKEVNLLNALDGTGYQFAQTRGLAVIESPFGLVACLPMGMAQVSSVVMTAEEGVTLRKGEELGYFQFGGSDFVMVFERSSNIELTNQVGVHIQQGTAIGNAYPY